MASLRPVVLAILFVALVSLLPAPEARAAPGAAAHPGSADPTPATGARKRSRGRSRRDTDRDGIPNKRDRDIDGDRKPNKRDRNIDGDRKPNKRDREMDADGTPNSRDRDIDADRVRNCPRDRDMDADRIRNTRDRDMDGDGLRNGRYRDPDIDGDGVRNSRDRDMDCDGILNFEDPDADGSGSKRNETVPSGVRLPKTFFGMLAEDVLVSQGGDRARLLSGIRATGVGTLRQTFAWSLIEPQPGVYDFAAYDAYMADTLRAGFSVLPILFDPPDFRSSRPATGAQHGTYPPRTNGEFADFAAKLVQRYGPAGSFWASHPSVPRRPIRAWQVWNEPHVPVFWPSGPNPAAYVGMVRTVGAGIERADPGAEVVSAAISESNLGVPLSTYVEGMYAAGARGAFDTLAIHPYATSADQTYDVMNSIRRIADRHGARDTPLWVTELGYATGGPESPFNVGHRGQAELVRRVLASLVRERDRLKLRGLIYFNWRDQPPYAPLFRDFFGLHLGLHEIDGRPKPALSAFTQTVRAMSAQ